MVAWQASRRQASRPGTGAAQAGVAQAAARWALKLMWRTWVGVVSLMRVPNEVASSASRNIFWPCRFLALSIYAPATESVGGLQCTTRKSTHTTWGAPEYCILATRAGRDGRVDRPFASVSSTGVGSERPAGPGGWLRRWAH
eukprot:scaffold26173_cov75-Phaeocystis_antarctica.AAC.3